VLVDRVGAEYLGLWNNAELAKQLGGHRTSPLIEVAARRYGVSLAKPELAGDGVQVFKEPRPLFFKAIAPFSLPPAPAPAEPPTARARHVATPPRIDGKLEAAWTSAPSVSWQTNYAGVDTGIVTTARFLWQEGALFAAFELEAADFNVDRSRPVGVERTKLYEEDCVELFLVPERPELHFVVVVALRGHFFDLEIRGFGKSSNQDWSSEPTIAATQNSAARTAVVEVRLRSPDLVRALVPGARLPLALYRMEGKAPRQYLAWRPAHSAKPQFHLPEGFGTLALEP